MQTKPAATTSQRQFVPSASITPTEVQTAALLAVRSNRAKFLMIMTGEEIESLQAQLAIASALDTEAGIAFGGGCHKDGCQFGRAAIAIDARTERVFAILTEQSPSTPFKVFGGSVG